ncbi:hypothetical protein ABRP58_01420 [Pectobacterium aroidearum]
MARTPTALPVPLNHPPGTAANQSDGHRPTGTQSALPPACPVQQAHPHQMALHVISQAPPLIKQEKQSVTTQWDTPAQTCCKQV